MSVVVWLAPPDMICVTFLVSVHPKKGTEFYLKLGKPIWQILLPQCKNDDKGGCKQDRYSLIRAPNHS
jgi:hypothetical protein